LDSNCIKKRSAGAQACRGSLQHSPDYLAEFKGAALQQGSDGREETKWGGRKEIIPHYLFLDTPLWLGIKTALSW